MGISQRYGHRERFRAGPTCRLGEALYDGLAE